VAKILIAPDSFKGSATSAQVAKALADGWKISRPSDEIVIAPFADGGEGTLDCIESVTPGSLRIPIVVQGATGIEHQSTWLLVGSDTAVIEMATLCGITTVDQLDPLGAHSYGLGQAIKAALADERVNEILIAVGGSASTDAGMGALSALGFKGLDANGKELARGGGDLHRLARVELPTAISKPNRGIKILVDVQSPLTGSNGAAHIFGPQKGANATQVQHLDVGLAHFLKVLNVDDRAGFGAAGGVSCGLAVLLNASIVSGVATIAELIGLQEKIKFSDCVITGEGSFDDQSYRGKAVGYLLEMAKDIERPVMIACGVNKNGESCSILSLVELAPSVQSAISDSQRWLIECGRVLASRFNH
jgi:glycerate 2-kinase